MDEAIGSVAVIDQRGAPVVGATVTITISGAPQSTTAQKKLTDANGRVHVPEAVEHVLDVGVASRSYVPWFRENAMGPATPSITVTLESGQTIRGWVSTVAGRQPGVRLRLAARAGIAPPISEFLAEDAIAAAAPIANPRSIHAREATTDHDGSFLFTGLDPEWHCALVVDDPRWMLRGPPVVVAAGASGVELLVCAPTTLAIHCRRAAGSEEVHGAMHALVQVRDAAGATKSFSFGGSASPLTLRFRADESWTDPLSYEIRLRGDGWSSHGACAGQRDRSSRVEMHVDGDATGAHDRASFRLFVQWPSGVVCEGPLSLWAADAIGRPVTADVLGRGDDGSFSVAVDRSAATIRGLVHGCWRSPSAAPTLDVRGIVDGAVRGMVMPGGATLVVTLPGTRRTTVQLVGPSGVRVTEVSGQLRLQGVEEGDVAAHCEIEGHAMSRSTTVVGCGEFHLNFAN